MSIRAMNTLFAKDPKAMSENEKIIWKVEIMKQSEDVDEEIDKRLAQIEEERERIKQTLDNNKNTITLYNEAVDRIAKSSRRKVQEEQKYLNKSPSGYIPKYMRRLNKEKLPDVQATSVETSRK